METARRSRAIESEWRTATLFVVGEGFPRIHLAPPSVELLRNSLGSSPETAGSGPPPRDRFSDYLERPHQPSRKSFSKKDLRLALARLYVPSHLTPTKPCQAKVFDTVSTQRGNVQALFRPADIQMHLLEHRLRRQPRTAPAVLYKERGRLPSRQSGARPMRFQPP